ncbi:MAG: hypothetical protein K6B46_06830 [Opitutales bacterium]|nr:hypothetical protein [Opitutales bacterium]
MKKREVSRGGKTKMKLLSLFVVGLMFLCGCHMQNDIVSNRLRFTYEEILIPVNTDAPVNLKFKNGYFDSEVSVFNFPKNGVKYNIVVTIGNIIVILKDEEWIANCGNERVFSGEPCPASCFLISAINAKGKPYIHIQARVKGLDGITLPLSEDCYKIIDNDILEIPISVKVLNCDPPIQNNQIRLFVCSNWYNHGRAE